MTSHLNDIQRLCTNLESDSELVIGEIYGLRQWTLSSDNDGNVSLCGHRNSEWDISGANEATCSEKTKEITKDLTLPRYSSVSPEQAVRRAVEDLLRAEPAATEVYVRTYGNYGLNSSYWVPRHALLSQPHWAWANLLSRIRTLVPCPGGFIEEGCSPLDPISIQVVVSVPVAPHEVTDPSCTCGFYAYTAEKSLLENSWDKSRSIFGVVKAWGHVTQGTKGFRAQKAQIVGLTVPLTFTRSYEMPETLQATFVTKDATPEEYATQAAPIHVARWVPATAELSYEARRRELEQDAIPTTVPRYSDWDHLLRAYKNLTGEADDPFVSKNEEPYYIGPPLDFWPDEK